jgi:hypothetical protein
MHLPRPTFARIEPPFFPHKNEFWGGPASGCGPTQIPGPFNTCIPAPKPERPAPDCFYGPPPCHRLYTTDDGNGCCQCKPGTHPDEDGVQCLLDDPNVRPFCSHGEPPCPTGYADDGTGCCYEIVEPCPPESRPPCRDPNMWIGPGRCCRCITGYVPGPYPQSCVPASSTYPDVDASEGQSACQNSQRFWCETQGVCYRTQELYGMHCPEDQTNLERKPESQAAPPTSISPWIWALVISGGVAAVALAFQK